MKVGGEELGLVPTHQTGLNSQLLFQDDPLRFGCTAPPNRVGDPPVPKPREIASGFAEARYFPPQASEFRHNPYGGDHRPGTAATRDWTENDTSSGDGSDGNEEEDDDDDDDDEGFDGLVGESSRAPNEVANLNNNSNSSANSSGGVVKLSNGKTKLGPLFGCAREVAVAKDGNTGQIMSETRASCGEIHQQQGRMGNFENAVTVAEPDGELYYSQYLRGAEVSGGGQKDVMAADGGCGFSGRKDGSLSVDSGESLRTLFSDPLTGALMDDAMVLPCGHSFGGGGIQHVDRMKACPTCSQSVPEGSILPNLSLRAAIQAFQREEDLHFHRSSKRRRDRFDQERGNCPDLNPMDTARGRGVQFPFAVTDRVIIKGNKRTPERFVGREAIVTTQCLNGWYVVKTLDNAESVKLQYRSLAKVPDDSSSKAMSCKTNPNWL